MTALLSWNHVIRKTYRANIYQIRWLWGWYDFIRQHYSIAYQGPNSEDNRTPRNNDTDFDFLNFKQIKADGHD